MTINELFTAVTTSRVDVESMIANSTDKEFTFKHIMWHIPAGIRYTEDKEMAKNIKDLINAVATELDVNKDEIFEEDGVLTDIEKLASSTIEVETKPENPSTPEDDEPKDDETGDEEPDNNDEPSTPELEE